MVMETNGPDQWIIDGLVDPAARPVAFSFLTGTVELIGEVGTDFDPFRAEGVPGLHLAYLRGSPIYHTPEDSIDRVDRSSLYHHGVYCLSLARHFGNVDLASAPESVELVYFTVGRFWLARYPAGWGLPLAIAAAALLGVVAVATDQAGRTERRVAHRWYRDHLLRRPSGGAGLHLRVAPSQQGSSRPRNRRELRLSIGPGGHLRWRSAQHSGGSFGNGVALMKP